MLRNVQNVLQPYNPKLIPLKHFTRNMTTKYNCFESDLRCSIVDSLSYREYITAKYVQTDVKFRYLNYLKLF
jgi:hypothetical protein